MTEKTSTTPAKGDTMPDGACPGAPAKSQFLLIYALAKKTLDTLTPQESVVMQDHATYLRKQADAGLITWGGLAPDPAYPRGFVMVESASENEVKIHVSNDPAVKAGILACAVSPFNEAFRAKVHNPLLPPMTAANQKPNPQ